MSITALAQRFGADRSGLAALEFAFIAPIMIVLFFGVIEGSDALSASRRASLAVNTLADLVAQETEIGKDDLDDLFDGVEDIISTGSPITDFRIVSLVYDAVQDKILVDWSLDSSGATPYAKDTEYTGAISSNLLDDTSSIIVGELTYNYKSTISKYVFSDYTMNKTATRWPRRSLSVTYCGATCP
ncbi:MAG: TadE/TadG family type IV pilus assembly protein [Pseudomonadota bacterium]